MPTCAESTHGAARTGCESSPCSPTTGNSIEHYYYRTRLYESQPNAAIRPQLFNTTGSKPNTTVGGQIALQQETTCDTAKKQ
uniref:Uncharacterized protein n=1 Tax=Ascaris lumbricoides TaxID=6252 RepID=A0A0M3HUB0_ASCLU